MKIKKLGFAAAAFLTIGMTVQVAQATSLNGISANTTKETYKFGSIVKLAVKNDNQYETTSFITPQKLVNGKWKDMDWFDSAILKEDEKTYTMMKMGPEYRSRGTYRFEIETLHGDNKSDGTIRTKKFVIK